MGSIEDVPVELAVASSPAGRGVTDGNRARAATLIHEHEARFLRESGDEEVASIFLDMFWSRSSAGMAVREATEARVAARGALLRFRGLGDGSRRFVAESAAVRAYDARKSWV